MPDPVSPLAHASFDGFAKVREIGPLGMITLRAKPDVAELPAAILAATGTAVPAPRRIVVNGDRAAGWMSPDEYLLIVPGDQVQAALAAIAAAMGTAHHLAVDVSDARAIFRIEGPKAAQVLQKLMPVDFATLEAGELRRSRAAQVAAAIWEQDGGFTLVAFRSVAAYVFGLLGHAAMPGSEIG